MRTTRFANESIIHSGINANVNDPVKHAHDRFMKAVYDASYRILENRNNNKYDGVIYRCDRIICNNSPQKWNDIYSALYQSSDIMKVYVRKLGYSINFELVIVDERIAFIHFYQTKHAGHNNSEIQKIKSTLKILDPVVCVELSKVFDRLHHIDFDGKCCDLSRTLLGVEKDFFNSDQSPDCGYFTMKNCSKNTSAKNHINDQFLNAIINWKFPSDNEDRIIMAAGYIKVFEIFDIESFFKKVGFSEDEKKSIYQKLEVFGGS